VRPWSARLLLAAARRLQRALTRRARGATVQPPVFLTDREALASDVVVLSGAEGRHAATVRRLRPGERADVTDGAGLVAECVVAGPADCGPRLTVLARGEV